jgi:hypothetical protein
MTDNNQLQRLLCRGTLFLALLLTAVPMALSAEALAAELSPNPASEYTAYPESMNRDIHPNQVQPEDDFYSFGAR